MLTARRTLILPPLLGFGTRTERRCPQPQHVRKRAGLATPGQGCVIGAAAAGDSHAPVAASRIQTPRPIFPFTPREADGLRAKKGREYRTNTGKLQDSYRKNPDSHAAHAPRACQPPALLTTAKGAPPNLQQRSSRPPACHPYGAGAVGIRTGRRPRRYARPRRCAAEAAARPGTPGSSRAAAVRRAGRWR